MHPDVESPALVLFKEVKLWWWHARRVHRGIMATHDGRKLREIVEKNFSWSGNRVRGSEVDPQGFNQWWVPLWSQWGNSHRPKRVSCLILFLHQHLRVCRCLAGFSTTVKPTKKLFSWLLCKGNQRTIESRTYMLQANDGSSSGMRHLASFSTL